MGDIVMACVFIFGGAGVFIIYWLSYPNNPEDK